MDHHHHAPIVVVRLGKTSSLTVKLRLPCCWFIHIIILFSLLFLLLLIPSTNAFCTPSSCGGGVPRAFGGRTVVTVKRTYYTTTTPAKPTILSHYDAFDGRKMIYTALHEQQQQQQSYPPDDDNNDPVMDDDLATTMSTTLSTRNPIVLTGLGIIAFLYWYWLVFGAAAKANGLPFIPDFLPMVPGWPPTEQDLQGPLEDFPHFFYLSELIGNTDAPYAPPTRLAVYNVAEAWIFGYLPALWKDPWRLPRPILLALWAILGINLTNAFLAPYLLVTAALGGDSQPPTESQLTKPVREKNRLVSAAFGGIATAVVAYALLQTVTATTMQDWETFFQTCQQDRTYFAFVVDLVLFSILQPYILKRADGGKEENRPLDYVPLVGLLAWLFE